MGCLKMLVMDYRDCMGMRTEPNHNQIHMINSKKRSRRNAGKWNRFINKISTLHISYHFQIKDHILQITIYEYIMPCTWEQQYQAFKAWYEKSFWDSESYELRRASSRSSTSPTSLVFYEASGSCSWTPLWRAHNPNQPYSLHPCSNLRTPHLACLLLFHPKKAVSTHHWNPPTTYPSYLHPQRTPHRCYHWNSPRTQDLLSNCQFSCRLPKWRSFFFDGSSVRNWVFLVQAGVMTHTKKKVFWNWGSGDGRESCFRWL